MKRTARYMHPVMAAALLAWLPAVALSTDFSTWQKRAKFQFTGFQQAGTLQDFPAFVCFSTNMAGFVYSQFLSPPNADLRFTDSTETNELKYEIESWDTNAVPAIASPTAVPGVGLWLRADVGAQTNGSGGVTNWLDQSGNNLHAFQSTPGYCPVLVGNAMGGKPVVRFDGTDDGMTIGDISLRFPTAATAFVVARINNDDGHDLFITSDNSTWWRYNGDGMMYPGMFRTSRIDSYAGGQNAGTHVFAVESSAAKWEFWVDGASRGARAADYNPGNNCRLGQGDVPTLDARNLSGDIAEVIFYNRALTSPEHRQVGGYLAKKYGMTESYRSGVSYVWVQVPRFTDNTSIWAFWGKGALTAPSYRTNGIIWSSGYVGVWHMDQTSDTDSSPKGYHGTANGTVISTTGKIGPANDFDRATDFIQVTDRSDFTLSGDYTVSAWVRSDYVPDNEGILGTYNGQGFIFAFYPTDNNLMFWENGVWRMSDYNVPEGAWSHVAYTRTGTTGKFYVNGRVVKTRSDAMGATDGGNLYLGSGGPSWNYVFDGRLDEIRISNVLRGSNWLWACWLNAASNGTVNSGSAVLAGGVPFIRNAVATNVTKTSACMNGYLVSTGLASTMVRVYSGTNDGGETASAWQRTNFFAGAKSPGTITTNVTGLVSNRIYYYRYFGTNSSGGRWATPSAALITGSVWIQPGRAGNEQGMQPVLFTVHRPAWATAAALQVSYSVSGGTAVGGTDYGTPSGATTIPVGATNGVISISPVHDQNGAEGNENIILQLASGPYVVGSANTATGVIVDSTGRGFYVTPAGAGTRNGAGWANAFSNAATAVNSCTVSGDSVYVKSGSYALTNSLTVSGKRGFRLAGGYAASAGDAAALSGDSTVFSPGSGLYVRLMYGNAVTAHLERVTFSGGYLNPGGNGAGLWFSNSVVTVTNCVVTGCMVYNGAGYGIGMYTAGGRLRVYNSQFNGNYCTYQRPTHNRGGGIAAENCDVVVSSSSFSDNWTRSRHWSSMGGALYLAGGLATVRDCVFSGNRAMHNGNSDGPGPAQGGAIYASSVNPLRVEDSRFTGNAVPLDETTYGDRQGAALYVTGVMTASVVRCVFASNGTGGDPYKGAIYVGGGRVGMTNVLVSGTVKGAGLYVYAGTVTVANCTSADNADWGLLLAGGVMTAQDSILSGNTNGGMSGGSARYTCGQEYHIGDGHQIADPVFHDRIYYHLKSRAGVYKNGYFSGGAWGVSTTNSPMIDRGEETRPWQTEPHPNGLRLNLGAYGNTPVASKTFLEEPGVFTSLTVYAYSPTNRTLAGVTLHGEVLATGSGGNPQVKLCWDTSDKGTNNLLAWTHSETMGTRPANVIFSTNITGLVNGQTYWCRAYGTNGTGQDWSPAQSFQILQPPVMTNLGAWRVRRTSAVLKGQVISNGGQAPAVWIHWWQVGAGATSVVPMGVICSGDPFQTTVTNLLLGALHRYKVVGSNVSGVAVSTVRDFTTLTASPIGRYLTGAGAGVQDGTSWNDAYGSFADALADCTYAGDTICVKYGTYKFYDPLTLSGYPGLIVRGGYQGMGTPGARTNLATYLTRLPDRNIRVVSGSSSTVTLERVTIKDGYLPFGGNGAGLSFVKSRLTLTNCIVTNCYNVGPGYGGGLYIGGGTLLLADTRFSKNYFNNNFTYGGGVAASGTAVTVTGCLFDGNYTHTRHWASLGGAVCLNKGSATIRASTFLNNQACNDGNTDGPGPAYGGAVYANGVQPLVIEDSRFTGNRNPWWQMSTDGERFGAAVYVSGVTTASMRRCVLTDNGNTNDNYKGTIYVAGGRVGLTNVVVARTAGGHGLYHYAGTVSVVRSTFANNGDWGIYRAGGEVSVDHSIFRGNTNGGISAGTITCTCGQEPHLGNGNLITNPVFHDLTYYHLKSRAGVYTNGYFSGGGWGVSSTNSPLLDYGDENAPWQDEPHPNGLRVNLGAYANTPVASKSFLEEPGVFSNLTVFTYAPNNLTVSSANLRGEVLATGSGGNPQVKMCWGQWDGGTNGFGGWQHVEPMGTRAVFDIFSTNVLGLVGGISFYCRAYATNATAQDWSPLREFTVLGPPVMTNMGAYRIKRTIATLRGKVKSSGGEAPSTWLHYWQDGSDTTSAVPMGVRNTDPFQSTVSNLLLGTMYHYRVLGSNSSGRSWSTVRDFTTLTTASIGRYLTTVGAGFQDGTAWTNAYATFADVLSDCTYAGDTIYVKYGSYKFYDPFTLVDHPGLVVRGGYEGVGAPGARTNAATVLTRLTDRNIRVMYGSASTVTLDRVTIKDGYLPTGGNGAGLCFVGGSRLTLTNCIVTNCYNIGPGYGAGLYIGGGTLLLADTRFSKNYFNNNYTYGGGVAASGTTVTITGCLFEGNYTHTRHWASLGGAIYLNGKSATVRNSTFLNNQACNDGNNDSPGPAYGGAIYAAGVRPLTVEDSQFTGNRNPWWQMSGYGERFGTVLYMTGNTTGTVSRCVMANNGNAADTYKGSVYIGNGRLALANVLVARTPGSYGCYINAGTVTVANCTLVYNGNWGLWVAGGVVNVRDSIAWGNTNGGISGASARYTCSQQILPGDGNVSVNPLFVDTTYYHLQSYAGQYVGGYFSGGSFGKGTQTSPLVDAGDPASPDSLEPKPNSRVNMGAYGNTPVAAKSPAFGTILVVR